MDCYGEVCGKYIKPKSKYKHFMSNILRDFDKFEHIVLSLNDIDINNVDNSFQLCMIEHNKKFD